MKSFKVTSVFALAAYTTCLLFQVSCCNAFVVSDRYHRSTSSPLLQKNTLSTTLQQKYKEQQQQQQQQLLTTQFALPPTTTSIVTSDAATSSLSNSQYLLRFFLETLIANGIPAVLTIIVIAFAASQFRSAKKASEDDDDMFDVDMKNPAADLYRDLYSGDDVMDNKNAGPMKFLSNLLKPPSKGGVGDGENNNRGVPDKQYISIKNLNQKFDSYEYSLIAGTQSKAKAAANYRAKKFDRAMQLALEGTGINSGNGAIASMISPYAKTTLLQLEQKFLKKGSKLLDTIQSIQTEMTRQVIDETMDDLGMLSAYELDPFTNNTVSEDASSINATSTVEETTTTKAKKKSSSSSSNKKKKESMSVQLKKLNDAQKELLQLELDFIGAVVETLGAERATGIRMALLGDISARGSGGLLTQLQERPLSAILNSLTFDINNTEDDSEAMSSHKPGEGKRLFVANFPGDVAASQLNELREEVTAIIRSSKPGDEVMVILQSGGGTVTGYGLAAAQLLRFRENNIKLTIAVEQVAASGGYMMSCVADKIVASPFAVLGSIGVITEIPNVYERLKKEGIEFQTITAGKFKRTVTPTKKVTDEDLKKTKEDIEDVLGLFRDFVAENRPQLNITEVATGETWLGTDALKMGLCDEIKTVDDVIVDYINDGWSVFEVAYTPPPEQVGLGAASLVPGGSSNTNNSGSITGLVRNGIRWVVKTVATEIRSELEGEGSISSYNSIEKRYMAKDDKADRIRTQG